jgi:hypothetical protein
VRGYRVVASEWICFEHTGFARTKAEQWWKLRSTEPPPATVARGDAPHQRSPRADVDPDAARREVPRVVSAALPPIEQPRASVLPRACWSCMHWNDTSKVCQRWECAPPADVLPIGCEAWSDEEELPF